ncbi:MAG TPA: DUF2191 domain-containing protein [Novosphingobium sp.]|nr:DUF2191 domain-containing protein [Novosphingobium sp.]
MERSAKKGRSEATAELNELWKRASELSGITDKAELERAAITDFIRREAGRQLAALGGTMPDAKAPPRRRATW